MDTETKTARETHFTEPNEFEIVATHTYDAPRELVWRAYTEPELLRQWSLGPDGWTMTATDMDLRPGGAWHWAWVGPNGERVDMGGEYREVEPPRKLVNTESWGGDWPDTMNTLLLTDVQGRTVATSTVLYPSLQAKDAAIGTGMKEGWARSNERLDDLLSKMLSSD